MSWVQKPPVVLEQLCCQPGTILLQHLPHIKHPSCQVKICQLKNCCHPSETRKQTKATPSPQWHLSNNLRNVIKQWLFVYIFILFRFSWELQSCQHSQHDPCNLAHIKEERLKQKKNSKRKKKSKEIKLVGKYQEIFS